MKKITYYTIDQDTGSGYNSFTGHYTSVESLVNCLSKSVAFIDYFKMKARDISGKEGFKLINGFEDFKVELSFQKKDGSKVSHWGYQLYCGVILIKVSNIKIAKGHYESIPEVKVVGEVYSPASHKWVEESTDTLHLAFEKEVILDSLLLDMVHQEHDTKTDLEGNLVDIHK